MDIEFVRSRFIKHFDGTTGSVYASQVVSTLSVNTQTTMVVSYSQVQLTKI